MSAPSAHCSSVALFHRPSGTDPSPGITSASPTGALATISPGYLADERQHEGVGIGCQLKEEELAQARRDPLGWWARGHWLLARGGGRANQSAVEGEYCGGRALWRAAWLACVSTGTSAALLPQFGPIHQRFVREAARNRSQDSFPSDATCSPRSVAPVKSRKRPRSSAVPEAWSVFCRSRSSSYSTPPTVANSEPRCSRIGATSVDWTDRAV